MREERRSILTRHAVDRCTSRHIPLEAVDAAIDFGCRRIARGAEIFTIGWREILEQAAFGLDLAHWEGVEVVCTHDGRIVTVYRNKHSRAVRKRPL